MEHKEKRQYILVAFTDRVYVDGSAVDFESAPLSAIPDLIKNGFCRKMEVPEFVKWFNTGDMDIIEECVLRAIVE